MSEHVHDCECGDCELRRAECEIASLRAEIAALGRENERLQIQADKLEDDVTFKRRMIDGLNGALDRTREALGVPVGASIVEHAKTLVIERKRWRFVADSHGGHMLSVPTGDKWYPESFVLSEGKRQFNSGVEAAAKCPGACRCAGCRALRGAKP